MENFWRMNYSWWWHIPSVLQSPWCFTWLSAVGCFFWRPNMVSPSLMLDGEACRRASEQVFILAFASLSVLRTWQSVRMVLGLADPSVRCHVCSSFQWHLLGCAWTFGSSSATPSLAGGLWSLASCNTHCSREVGVPSWSLCVWGPRWHVYTAVGQHLACCLYVWAMCYSWYMHRPGTGPLKFLFFFFLYIAFDVAYSDVKLTYSFVTLKALVSNLHWNGASGHIANWVSFFGSK